MLLQLFYAMHIYLLLTFKVNIQNGSGQLVLKGVGAGSTVVSFVCVENTTELDLNSSCPISE